MDRGLVVVDHTESHRELLTEAAEHAAGADAELVLLTTMTEAEYEEKARDLETIGSVENVTYSSGEILDGVAARTREFAAGALGDVSTEVVARVADDGDLANAVITTAEDHDCDHVFLLGRRRSPTGKAVFGDVAQQVVLNFDGFVTVSTQ
ncbi:universal stress protein [Halomarina oriensis]|uniref:Universal stress protein n=1 Tax=Halomarina oriensis TaxID=671145 RepID=A0A6B0GPE1_9EURY|nr:universal stress protein [Halomarina oriensis]MWG33488.1 universal stress protein [Halomarina oriensis]